MSLLTRHGYIVNYDDFGPEHRRELTVTPKPNPMFNPKPESFTVYDDRFDGTVSVPRYWGEEHFGESGRMFGHVEAAEGLVFNGELRSEVQRQAVNASLEQLEKHGGGVLSLPTGVGKTVIALHIACRLRLKTLVVVHKTFLMDQWEERIRKFIPGARIGRLQQNVEEVEECNIVVGMLQSLAMREYDDETFDDFGLIIFDEVHVVPAPVLSRALLKLCAPKMLGLSATPVRKDGLSFVIHWFIGPTFFQRFLSDQAHVTVDILKYRPSRALPFNMAAATSLICNMQDRNRSIVNKIADLVELGHKVLLLSDRRAHCESLLVMLRESGIDGALYMGGMKRAELELSERSQVMLGTFSLAKEGLDIPSLDALILASPRSDVVQACGRILHGKTALEPIIVDVVDQWSVGLAQFRKRCVYYDSAGFVF